jgi:hypothetical protein
MSPEGFLKDWVITIGYFDDQGLNVVDQARASMHDAFFTQNLLTVLSLLGISLYYHGD